MTQANPLGLIDVCVPYTDVVTGHAYLTCVPPDGMSHRQFVAGLREGSIDPLEHSVNGRWDEVSSKLNSFDTMRAYDMNDETPPKFPQRFDQ